MTRRWRASTSGILDQEGAVVAVEQPVRRLRADAGRQQVGRAAPAGREEGDGEVIAVGAAIHDPARLGQRARNGRDVARERSRATPRPSARQAAIESGAGAHVRVAHSPRSAHPARIRAHHDLQVFGEAGMVVVTEAQPAEQVLDRRPRRRSRGSCTPFAMMTPRRVRRRARPARDPRRTCAAKMPVHSCVSAPRVAQ